MAIFHLENDVESRSSRMTCHPCQWPLPQAKLGRFY